MTDMPGLFPADPTWTVAVTPAPATTAGERRRARQLQCLHSGLHPLTLTPSTRPIRLHPDVDGKDATKDNIAYRPIRCGTCQYRQRVHGGNRDYPKCLYGAPLHPNGNINTSLAPRASHGDNTDVAAWWPACVDYQPDTTVATTDFGPCGDVHEPDGDICPEPLRLHPGAVQVRCPRCKAWHGALSRPGRTPRRD